MKKCPYCFEDLASPTKDNHCPYCHLLMENTINLDYPSVDRKKCYFCGKMIAKEAKFCRFCQKWIDEVDRVVKLLEEMDKEEE